MKKMPRLGTDCLASAVEGKTWWTETARRPDLASVFFVTDSEVPPPADRSLLSTVIEQGTYWHLKSPVSWIAGLGCFV